MLRRQLRKRITNFFNGRDLKARIARGGLWLGAGNGVEHTLRLLRNIILARLLAPEAFGLMAIVLAVNSAFEAFTSIGIKEALIHSHKGNEPNYVNGAWWLAFARSIIIFTLAYFSSPWVANLYDSSELLSMLRVSFLSILFNGAMSSAAYVALKQMNFKRWAIIFQGGGVCGILTAIVLAFSLQNVWALVIGYIIEAAARCLLSFIVCPFRPWLHFDREALKALFGYSRGIFGLPILVFIFMKVDIFFVAKLCSKSDLGLYSMAAALARVPSLLISMFISPILMPAFSEMQDDNERVRSGIIKTTSLIAFLGVPLIFFLSLYARELLTLAYGAQYDPVAVVFCILCVTTFLQVCSSPIAAVYLATGHPKLHRLFAGVRATLILSLIYPAIEWFGLSGAATASLIAIFVAYLFQLMRIRAVTGLDVQQYGGIFLRSTLISFPIFLGSIVTYNFLPAKPFIKMIPGVISCAILYSIYGMIFFRSLKPMDFFQRPMGETHEVKD